VSLKAFHVLFIVMSVLLAFGLGLWGLHHQSAEHAGYYWIGVSSTAVGIALIGYGVWFIQKIQKGLGQ
jgi:hypothetical protein